MCGIIGYAGPRPALPLILAGLERLEYRGYDSTGIAVLDPGGSLFLSKSAGKMRELRASLDHQGSGTLGIGHTRWATHGRPTRENAHPHTDCTGDVAVVHNGIVEDHRELRERLTAAGHRFLSETDTEVIPHVIESCLAEGLHLEEAMRRVAAIVTGVHAIVALSRREPDRIVGLRLGNAGGLVVGYGKEEMFLASDLPAIAPHVGEAVYLSSGEMVTMTGQATWFSTLDGAHVVKERQSVLQDPASVAKGRYRHFMLKEIVEQPEALMGAIRDRIDFEEMRVALNGFPFTLEEVRSFKRVVLVGMGSSFHAAQLGQFMVEALARLPAQAENASEFRYRDPLIDSSTLVISVGQSGETADTLAAMAEAQSKGARQITISNVAGSQASRLAEYTLSINAGPEVGVASTKTFTGSLLCLYLLAAYLGGLRGALSPEQLRGLLDEVILLPKLMGQVLEEGALYEALARRYFQFSSFLLLGRGIGYPVAMEGALKLKEIAYIHAEGYQAGEMKHGPIALIDEKMPVVAIALRDRLYEKMAGNMEEVRARGGRLIALATAGDESTASMADDVLFVPEVSPLIAPILATAPLQLLAYHVAVQRGCDIDQPRNLAKTVTVE